MPIDLPLVGMRGEALRPDTWHQQAPPAAWQRRSAGEGSRCRRYYDWAAHAVTVKNQSPADGFARQGDRQSVLVMARGTGGRLIGRNVRTERVASCTLCATVHKPNEK